MYCTMNVICFYSYKPINIYQNIAWRKNRMATASDEHAAISDNIRQSSGVANTHRHTDVIFTRI